jgi:hypothetical protein
MEGINMNEESNTQGQDTQGQDMEIGCKVRLRRDVERFPHFIARAGLTGKVTEVAADYVAVAMDDYLKGAEEWGNEIVWDVGGHLKWIAEDLEVIDPPLLDEVGIHKRLGKYGAQIWDTGGGCMVVVLPNVTDAEGHRVTVGVTSEGDEYLIGVYRVDGPEADDDTMMGATATADYAYHATIAEVDREIAAWAETRLTTAAGKARPIQTLKRREDPFPF